MQQAIAATLRGLAIDEDAAVHRDLEWPVEWPTASTASAATRRADEYVTGAEQRAGRSSPQFSPQFHYGTYSNNPNPILEVDRGPPMTAKEQKLIQETVAGITTLFSFVIRNNKPKIDRCTRDDYEIAIQLWSTIVIGMANKLKSHYGALFQFEDFIKRCGYTSEEPNPDDLVQF